MKFFKKKHVLIIALQSFIVVFLVFLLFKKDVIKNVSIQRDLQEQYPFTSPIIDCQNIENNTAVAINSNKFGNIINQLEQKYQIVRSSVYYRDLSNGQWVGINEREVFSPASMMKTPVFISFLKQVEKNPDLLKKQVVAEKKYFEYELQQNFNSSSKVEIGKTYTLQQLAEIMIEHSDNIATIILSSYIQGEDFDNLFKAVGVEFEKDKGDALIRIKDFAAFFRILYNASYLNRDTSDFALSILANTTFKAGLVAGVPGDIPVAHKYGERVVKNIDTKAISDQQLHDCGIIYHKKNPYILCVMTQGKDFNNQLSFIEEISRYIYESVSGQH